MKAGRAEVKRPESEPGSAGRVTGELFTIPVDGAYLVYAPLQCAAFIANAQTVNLIADLQERRLRRRASEYKELTQFLRQLRVFGHDEGPKPITSFSGSPKPTMVALFLTTACNLRCKYCLASAGDRPRRVMSLEAAQHGIDFVIANAVELKRSGIQIAYHGGGEPSVNWATLTGSHVYAVRRAKEAGLTLTASMATNGVLSDSKINWITRHLSGISLSYDGLPEVHDRHRVDLLGRGSSAGVCRTIRRLDEARFPYGLRMTVTHDGIPYLEGSIRYVCENFRPHRIQVEPAYAMGRWRDAPSTETEEFITAFRGAQAAARELGREIQFSGARLGLLTNHFCGVSQDSFSLTADEQVSACYEVSREEDEWSPVFLYGAYSPLNKTYAFNFGVLDHLRQQSVDHRTFCQGCFAKWSCGGDCYRKYLTGHGPGEFRGSARCHIIRELTKDQILDRITKSGGVFWYDRGPVTARVQEAERFQ